MTAGESQLEQLNALRNAKSERVKLTITVTVYNSEHDLPAMLPALSAFSEELKDAMDVECVFVVDGSTDGSENLLRARLPEIKDFTSQLHVLSRNFGAPYALRCAMEKGTGDFFAPIPPDLQESPAVIRQAIEALIEGQADVVIGTPVKRGDPLVSRLMSWMFWGIFRRLIEPTTPREGIGFIACTRTVRDQLMRIGAMNSFFISEMLWVGYRRLIIPYEKAARRRGKSSWSLMKKLKYFTDCIVYGSIAPLRIFTLIGGLVTLAGAGLAVAVVVSNLRGEIAVSGYTTLVVLVTLFGGLSVLGIGMIGEYVGRILDNVRQRPVSIVARSYLFSSEP